MSRGSNYAPLTCNLCWKEMQAPFLVTSCNHVFCMDHREHERFNERSCPGCGSHLPGKNGVRQASYTLKTQSDMNVLNGVMPDYALKVAANAIKFWVDQERSHLQMGDMLALFDKYDAEAKHRKRLRLHPGSN